MDKHEMKGGNGHNRCPRTPSAATLVGRSIKPLSQRVIISIARINVPMEEG